jgi:hypothetical protein
VKTGKTPCNGTGLMVPLAGVHPQTASFGPERRFRFFEILNIAHAMPAVSK